MACALCNHCNEGKTATGYAEICGTWKKGKSGATVLLISSVIFCESFCSLSSHNAPAHACVPVLLVVFPSPLTRTRKCRSVAAENAQGERCHHVVQSRFRRSVEKPAHFTTVTDVPHIYKAVASVLCANLCKLCSNSTLGSSHSAQVSLRLITCQTSPRCTLS